MELPRGPDGNMQIGVTDLLSYRECPQRFAHGMRRHSPLPERFQFYPGERMDMPGHTTQPNAYGSAIHEAIALVEKTACSDEAAIDAVWKNYQHWLEVEDVERMRIDLQTYRKRSSAGYRIVAVEEEMRVPLFTYKGEIVFFRFKIDVLLQHMQNPGLFVMRDYKSGRIPKSEGEVHKDIQQWLYNWAVHELHPECQTLVQLYDQLRYGVVPTQKTARQRAQVKDWAIRQVIAVLEDEHLKPTLNEHCSTCPLLMDCRVTHLASQYWQRRVAMIAPETKAGRKTVVQLGGFDYYEYTDALPKVNAVRKMLERFEKTVKDDLKAMPEKRRAHFGYKLADRRGKTWRPEAKKQAAVLMQEAFWHVADFSITALESFYGKRGSDEAEDTPLQDIMDLADEKIIATMVVKDE